MSDILTIEQRVEKLEGEVIRIDESMAQVPDAVLARISEGFAQDLAPHLRAALLAESGAIVRTGCKQLSVSAVKTVYAGGKAAVKAPFKACQFAYAKTVGRGVSKLQEMNEKRKEARLEKMAREEAAKQDVPAEKTEEVVAAAMDAVKEAEQTPVMSAEPVVVPAG